MQFHPVGGEHGSNEFQIAHLLINSKCSPRLLKPNALVSVREVCESFELVTEAGLIGWNHV